MANIQPDRGGLSAAGYSRALTASSGSAQDATSVLQASVNIFDTVVTAGDSATLPSVEPGTVIYVKNNSASYPLDLFPNTGETINGGSSNAAISIATGTCLGLIKESATNWEQITESTD